MSARPRPVTATVNPPLTSTPLHGPRTFLSSDGSTESLVSILDHDSCESLESDVEDDHVTNRESTDPTDGVTKTDVTSPTPSQIDGRLTPWEKWMIQKAKDLRLQQRKQTAKVKKLKEEKEKEEKEKAVKQMKCEKTVQQWNERKVLEISIRKKMEDRKQKAEEELKAAEKKLLDQKVQAKFDEWQNKKMEEEKERKRKEKEKHEEEAKKEAEKKNKAEVKYKEWLKEAKKRPRSAPHSFGYTDGKLKGYYDRCTYPAPSFYNPIPWQPIPVPNPVTTRKPQIKAKKNTRKRFNPKKYL